MKKLTALIVSAAMVPAFALSTAALAEDRDDMMGGDEQRAGEQNTGEQQRAGGQDAGGQHMASKPAGAFHADDVIGQNVRHRGSDEDVGTIQDLVIGEDGSVVGVVVTTSSFLGLGGQHVGLSWDQIERTMEDDEAVFYTDMDEEALRNAPEYQRD